MPAVDRIIPISRPWQIITTPDRFPLDTIKFSNELVKWFHKERAQIAVPGRGESDPYAIWVAEVMLQQTQVATVWPYYEKWLIHFPDIASLAQAENDKVLKLWEGLGYYSRARNLHKGASYIVQHFDGKLPIKVNDLLQVPGIGPYTAAAIASMAFNQKVPLIDGNVLRVMSRILRIRDDITKSSTKTRVNAHLEKLISSTEPGVFNQGLMDLGRVICTPKNPQCPDCPLGPVCKAFKYGDVHEFPVREMRKEIPHYDIVIGIIRRDDKVLIQKRPIEGMLGGLWEFPGGKIEPGETAEQALKREIAEETELKVRLSTKIGTIQHAYTHFKITMSAWWCEWREGVAQTHTSTENKWICMDEIPQYAFPKANLKILALVDNMDGSELQSTDQSP